MLKKELDFIQEKVVKYDVLLTREQAFNVLLLQYYCYKEPDLDKIWYELEGRITDAANDGGIDFVYFDEDENKVMVGQNKLSKNIDVNECVAEINKSANTIQDFLQSRTGYYNNKLKSVLQNDLDRLTDEYTGNVEIIFSSLSNFSKEKVISKIEDAMNKVSDVDILNEDDLENIVDKIKSDFETVDSTELIIDQPKNILKYETDELEGIFVNISAKSLIKTYNKYSEKGLFNLNIRRYVRNKNVDDGIKNTLDNDRNNFWFLNNGLTIACEDYYSDGNKIKLYSFSIVNGGQTTTLISQYKGNNNDDFYIPCKILKNKEKLSAQSSLEFFNKIAEATNSQKPIQPKDLKANAPEMRNLQNMLKEHKIRLEIKRGVEIESKYAIKLKNDELAQLIFSFVNQKPGTARSNKKSLFSNNKYYNSIFKNNYNKDIHKKEFLLDLIELNERYNNLSKRFKENEVSQFSVDESNIFNNGKTVIMGLFGVVYRLINEDFSIIELKNEPLLLEIRDFTYGSFISNYHEDDIDNKFEFLIRLFVEYLNHGYTMQYNANQVTSVSNFFKTDKKYLEDIVAGFASYVTSTYKVKETLMELGQILKRQI